MRHGWDGPVWIRAEWTRIMCEAVLIFIPKNLKGMRRVTLERLI